VVLAVAPLRVFELPLWHVVYFLAGVALVLLRGWLRWAVAVPLIGLDTVLLVVWDAPLGAPTVLGQVYEAVWTGERALIVFALAMVAGSVVRLVAARADLARAAVVRDRLRFARDLHDLFGYSLSVVVLKSELAVRLLDRDAARARAELAQGLDVARQTLADLASAADGYRAMSLAAEAETAQAVLSAAGVAVDGSVTAPTLPAETNLVLATVLREGVTNLLRHSAARRCRLSVETAESTVRLTLVNDGVTPATDRRPGMGLDSLTRRVSGVGGQLTAELVDDGFRLVVIVPLQPALLGGDADRVDAVAGVEPRDGRGQVVAHGSYAQEQR
jgi:two-component system sensor histidine kinase DesK